VSRGTIVAVVLLVGVFSAGCSSMKRSDTARTAREQLLISNAVDQSLNKVNFDSLRGRAILIEDKYLDCVDKGYLTASVRHRVARAGGKIAAKIDDADIVLEIRSGGVGTDTADSFLGTPAIAMPGMLAIPEIKLVSKTNQSAVAKIGLAAYDAKTMRLLGDGGTSLSKSTDNNWHVLGIGPYQNGSVHREIARGIPTTPGQPYEELPTVVAFAAPESSGRANVAGQPPPNPIRPASQTTPRKEP
jgi:hypothetical protein